MATEKAMPQFARLDELVFRERDLMELLGVDRGKLDYLRLQKGLPCKRVGLTRLYLMDEVLEWLRQQ